MPLVLHGGSCTPDEDIRRAIQNGIRKINIATELHQVYLDELNARMSETKGAFMAIDVFMHPVYDKMRELAEKKLCFSA